MENKNKLSIAQIRQSSIFSISGQVFEKIISIAIAWLLIKYLSTSEYGIYNLLLGTSVYLNILSSFGILEGASRYLPEFFQSKEMSKFQWVAKSGLIFRFALSLLIFLFINISLDFIGNFFNLTDYQIYFPIFVLSLIFLFQAQLLRVILQSIFLHKYSVIANIIYLLIKGTFISIFFSLGFGLYHVLIADLIASFLFMIIAYIFYKKALNNTNNAKNTVFDRKSLLKRIFRYSSFSLFNEIGVLFIDISTDLFVISHYLGTIQLGYYAFAARIGRMISELLPSRLFINVITPAYFARFSQTGDKNELNKMFHFVVKFNAYAIFPIFSAFIVLGKPIIVYFFDERFLSSYYVMLVLFIHFLMKVFPVALPLKAIEKPEVILAGKLSSIYNLIMDILLIHIWGIMGVAIATSSAMVFKKIYEYYMSYRLVKLTLPLESLFRISLNCIMIIGIGFLLRGFITGWISLLAIIFSLGLIYLILSYFNNAFLAEEKRIINKLIGKDILK